MLLIDLDPLIYACGFAAQKSQHALVVQDPSGDLSEITTDALAQWKKDHKGWEILDKETVIEPAPQAQARLIFDTTLRQLISGQKYRAFLSGCGNFREQTATIRPYKGNRDKAARPLHYDLLRKRALEWPGVEYTVGIEADDAISINAHSGAWDFDYTVVSIDKDLDQIPGKHWNYTKEGEAGKYVVTEQAAQETFIRQWITGDSTDNIEGVPGIGPRKAAAILKGLSGQPRNFIYNEMLALYGGNAAACEETARLVWLLHKPTEIWEAQKWIAGTM